MMADLPDLVRDSKLFTTRCDGQVTVHEYQDGVRRRWQRPVPRLEQWDRDPNPIGRGGFGEVWLERQRDNRDQPPRAFRAVKEIAITDKRVKMSDYLRELEAILKFSHDKV